VIHRRERANRCRVRTRDCRFYGVVNIAYYQEDRIHDALDKDTPNGRAVEKKPGPEATVISSPRLDGIHHRYAWRKAA
jgi:hypothetical protein